MLEDLLVQALPVPRAVGADGGAAISLALHCLLVEQGFIALEPDGRPRLGAAGRFRPPADWNSRPNEWIFLYARRGAANRFRLHCAALPGTGRVFVHACELGWEGEEPLAGRIAVLGLQLENYLPDPHHPCGANSWHGVISQEAKLEQQFSEHVVQLLLSKADPLSEGAEALPPPIRLWDTHLGYVAAWAQTELRRGAARCRAAASGQEAGLLMGAGVGAAAVALAAVALWARAKVR